MEIRKVWVSDCGQYWAVKAPRDSTAYDVLAVSGTQAWLSGRYEPAGDPAYRTDARYTHAEFPHLVVGWGNLGGWTRNMGRYVEAFSLDFIDVRQDLQLLPFHKRVLDPCPYLASYHASFHKQRRVSQATWQQLQTRIAQAILDGHATLAQAQPQAAD